MSFDFTTPFTALATQFLQAVALLLPVAFSVFAVVLGIGFGMRKMQQVTEWNYTGPVFHGGPISDHYSIEEAMEDEEDYPWSGSVEETADGEGIGLAEDDPIATDEGSAWGPYGWLTDSGLDEWDFAGDEDEDED